jgi:hypothetical protein
MGWCIGLRSSVVAVAAEWWLVISMFLFMVDRMYIKTSCPGRKTRDRIASYFLLFSTLLLDWSPHSGMEVCRIGRECV